MADKNKKLLVVVWHLGIGGMQKRLTDIAEQMGKENVGWQIYFLVKYKKESPFEERLLKLKNVEVDYFADSKLKVNSIKFLWWLAKKWQHIRPDVCLTFLDHLSVSCVLIKQLILSKTKLVLNESMLTSTYLRMQRGKWGGFWKKMVRRFYPKAVMIIVPTKAGRRDLINNFGIDGTKIVILPNWTNWKSGIALKSKDIDLLFVGRLDKEKGIDRLQKIWNEIANQKEGVKLAVIGSGQEDQKSFKNGFKRTVVWVGMSKDVCSWIDRSKVLVLPTRNEGMPNVVLEAGIRGVPTVTSNFEGAEEIIKNKYDGVIADSDIQMAKEILKLIDNSELRKKMGDRMQQKIKANFGQENQNMFINCLVG